MIKPPNFAAVDNFPSGIGKFRSNNDSQGGSKKQYQSTARGLVSPARAGARGNLKWVVRIIKEPGRKVGALLFRVYFLRRFHAGTGPSEPKAGIFTLF
jgi:hypothetical protein